MTNTTETTGKRKRGRPVGSKSEAKTPEILRLAAKGNQIKDIAKIVETDPAQVCRTLDRWYHKVPEYHDLNQQRADIGDIIDVNLFAALKSMSDPLKVASASYRDIVYGFKELNAASRLNAGLSTKNLAVAFSGTIAAKIDKGDK